MQIVTIQNKNQANTELNMKGDVYKIDENGVLTCSELVASMLLGTPGWSEYKRDFESEIETARDRKLRAESAFRKAKEELRLADEALARVEREAVTEKAAEANGAAALGPKADGADGEEPSLAWTKDRLLAYAQEYEVELGENPTKAEILAAINEQLEDE